MVWWVKEDSYPTWIEKKTSRSWWKTLMMTIRCLLKSLVSCCFLLHFDFHDITHHNSLWLIFDLMTYCPSAHSNMHSFALIDFDDTHFNKSSKSDKESPWTNNLTSKMFLMQRLVFLMTQEAMSLKFGIINMATNRYIQTSVQEIGEQGQARQVRKFANCWWKKRFWGEVWY